MNTYIGIDLGTSAVKLLLVGEDGSIRSRAQERYPVSFPRSGWSEQDPEDWYAAVLRGMGALLNGQDASAVRGISFGGQMHGLVMLDASDRVIRPCILWNDGRTQAETDYLNESVGRDTLAAETGNIAFAGFTAPKLLWVKENEPEHFARIRRIMLPKDYLIYRMCGQHAGDYSDASGTLLLDVKNRRWSEKMCAICGVTRDMLPALYESSACVGTLREEIRAQFSLPRGVKVAAGAGDNAAAAVGTGAVEAGNCNISLGTSGTVFLVSDAFAMDARNALHSFCHANGGYHLMGCILSAASCNEWWMKNILSAQDYAAEQEGLAASLGKNEVLFLPYLMGERSPHNDALARSAFLGMRPQTPRGHMTLAVLEGVAYALRDCVEAAKACGVRVTGTRICGGGAKSPLWRRIVADVLGIPVELPAVEEGPAYGAAMLAMAACGAYASAAEAAKALVRVRECILPDAGERQGYEEGYATYRRLYPALKGIFPQMKR